MPGIPIGALIGDQQASLFGQTAFEAGEAKCTFGTGSFLLLNTGHEIVRSRHGLITTVAHKVAGEPAVYALEGSIAVAGGLVQWVRDSLGLIRSPAEIETLAAGVPDNGGCYVVPAFSGLFAPYWSSAAQGIMVGPDVVCHQGAHRAGGAGGQRLADQGRGGRDECRRRGAGAIAARWTAG